MYTVQRAPNNHKFPLEQRLVLRIVCLFTLLTLMSYTVKGWEEHYEWQFKPNEDSVLVRRRCQIFEVISLPCDDSDPSEATIPTRKTGMTGKLLRRQLNNMRAQNSIGGKPQNKYGTSQAPLGRGRIENDPILLHARRRAGVAFNMKTEEQKTNPLDRSNRLMSSIV